MMSTAFQNIMPITYKSVQEGPHLLILAGVHGDEFEPVDTAVRLMTDFTDGRKLDRGTLTIVPIVNRPAYKNKSRTAMDGLDLARTCPGRKDGSETEQIAWEISQLIRSVDYLIDMHTGGKTYEIYPLSGYMLHPDQEILRKQRKMASAFGLPVQWGTSAALDGRTLSVARDAGVPAIYTEYGGGGSIDSKITDALSKGCLSVMASLNMIPHQNDHNEKPKYIVEDYQNGSGHLQIMNPSPTSGIFESEMDLGAMVKTGDTIGHVYDPNSGEVSEITATLEGLLFLIRRNESVKKDEATSGILPIAQPGKIIVT